MGRRECKADTGPRPGDWAIYSIWQCSFDHFMALLAIRAGWGWGGGVRGLKSGIGLQRRDWDS